MAALLELRPPFLDLRLVELAFPLPSNVKVRGRTTKWVVRKLPPGTCRPISSTGPRWVSKFRWYWFRDGSRDMAFDLLRRPSSFVGTTFPPGGGRQTARCTSIRRSQQASHGSGRCCRSKCGIASSSAGRVRRGRDVGGRGSACVASRLRSVRHRTLSSRSAMDAARRRPVESNVRSEPPTDPGRARRPCAPPRNRIVHIRPERLLGCAQTILRMRTAW